MAIESPRRLGVLAGLAVLLGAVFMLWHFDGAQDGTPVAVQERRVNDTGLTWRVGHKQQYRVTVASAFVMSMPGGAAQTLNLRIEGLLDQQTLAITAAGVMTGMRFNTFNLMIEGAADQNVNQALQSPFRTLFSKNGAPLGFEFPESLAPEHRDILKNLVSMFQLLLEDGDTWEATESNASGSYKAQYSRVSNTEISKQKKYYLPGPQGGSAPEVESTEFIAVDPNNDWITEMTFNEVVVTNEVGSAPTRVSNRATMVLLDTQPRVAANDWRFETAPEREQSEDPASALPDLQHEEALLQLDDVVSGLEQGDGDRRQLIHQLRDLLLVDDQLADVLLERLGTEDLTTHTRADLYLAFELAGTPSAQTALVTILADSSWPPEDAMRAIVALGGVKEPTDEALAALWDLARSTLADTQRRDLPGTAALAIGSLGSSLRENEASDYAALRSDLMGSASSAIEPTERAVFLYAVGNTGDPDPILKHDVASYLDDASPEVRSAAARTLARLGTAEVETQLLNSVKQEPNDLARASMIEALATWEEPPAEALAWTRQAIQQERDERARYNMAVLLGNNLDDYPENRRVLESLLESEQSKRVRQKVANMLY